MNERWGIITGLLYFNAVMGVLIAGRSWILRSRPGQTWFALLMAAAAFYSVTYGLEIASPSIIQKTLWLKIENISIVTMPSIWFLFVIRHNRQAHLPGDRYAAVIFVIPAITLFLLITRWSFLHYASLSGYSSAGGPLIIEGGPWYRVQAVHSYGLMVLSTLVFLWVMLRYPENYRGHHIYILMGLVIPWIFNFLYAFGSNFPTPIHIPVDLTFAAFTITGAIYSIGIFHMGWLDLVPLAHDIVFENIPELVMVLDLQDRIIELNRIGQQWLGLTRQKALGRTAAELLKGFPELAALSDNLQSRSGEFQIPGDPPRDLELFLTPLLDRRKKISGHVIVARDITSRKKADRILEEANRHINLQSAALEAAANAIIISDRQGLCIWVNPAFTRITGYSFDEMLGEKLSKLKSGVQDIDFYRDMWETILKGNVWNGEIVNKHKDGHLYTEEMTIAPVRNETGGITNFIAIKQDITARKKIETDLQNANLHLKLQVLEIETLQEKLREQAIRDPLTDLFNRRYLDETLEREIAKAKREGLGLCVAMLDVDHFKEFNDRYGHMVGDMILESLGKLLMKNTRQSDIACRFGGDEIVIVMPDISTEAAFRRAEEWRNSFQANYESFNLQDIHASISVGLAIFPIHGRDGQALINAADHALYQAKANGRNNVAIFINNSPPGMHGSDLQRL